MSLQSETQHLIWDEVHTTQQELKSLVHPTAEINSPIHDESITSCRLRNVSLCILVHIHY